MVHVLTLRDLLVHHHCMVTDGDDATDQVVARVRLGRLVGDVAHGDGSAGSGAAHRASRPRTKGARVGGGSTAHARRNGRATPAVVHHTLAPPALTLACINAPRSGVRRLLVR